jgi:hypothetical protein
LGSIGISKLKSPKIIYFGSHFDKPGRGVRSNKIGSTLVLQLKLPNQNLWVASNCFPFTNHVLKSKLATNGK